MTSVTTSDECDAGFVCVSGSTVPDPQDGITGYLCPAGKYCVQGCSKFGEVTPCPISCPDGYYNPITAAKSIVSCLKCLPGSFCGGTGTPAPTGLCEAGYYCPEGSGSTYKTTFKTTAGYYAPVGSDV